MSANQLVQAHVDGVIKEEAATILATMGLTISDAVRLLLAKVAQDKTLPFEPWIPNATTIAAMKQARAGQGETVTLDDLKAIIRAENQATPAVQA